MKPLAVAPLVVFALHAQVVPDSEIRAILATASTRYIATSASRSA
jgi:hypothetical protein